MKVPFKPALLGLSLSVAALTMPLQTDAEDIDIFVQQATGTSGNPNVLIVLDNTPNWARQSQQWPGGIQQGQSEANAIKSVIQSLDSSVNVGLMEFVTSGNANNNGGYIRFPVVPMTSANKAILSAALDRIYGNINDPTEKTNGSRPYGNLMYDVYNYFAGATTFMNNGSNGVDSTNGALIQTATDASGNSTNGYSTNWTKFKSPLSSATTCAKSFVIFIGNTRAAGPMSDDATNTSALKSLGGDTTELSLPEFQLKPVVSTSTTLGATGSCYASASAAQTALGWGLNVNDNICELYQSIGSQTASGVTDSASPAQTCNQYSISGTSNATDTVWQSKCTDTSSGYTNGCSIGDAIPNIQVSTVGVTTGYYSSAPAATSADAGAKATYSSGYQYTPSGGSAQTDLTCPAEAISCTYTVTAKDSFPTGSNLSGATAWTGDSNQCYKPNKSDWSFSTGDFGTPTCPAGFSCTAVCPSGATCGTNGNTVPLCPSTYYTCTYTYYGSSLSYDNASLCGSGSKKAILQQVLTPNKTYTVTRNMTLPGSAGACPTGQNKYNVVANNYTYTNVATGNTFSDTKTLNADEWANFMFSKGVPVSGSSNASIVTYTIDVYNAQPNNLQTSLLLEMSKVGGGKYFVAKSEDMIVSALKSILVEIQGTNTSFASSSLPVNASNRTQNENQVFIGMFRPDSGAKPRWFGNLKQYQIIDQGAGPTLGDANGNQAINYNKDKGFITDCAVSYWTTDLGAYWKNVTDGTSLLDAAATEGKCTDTTIKGIVTTGSDSTYADLPDGPLVEKGGVAEIIRQGNNPTTTSSSAGATWTVNRNVLTVASSTAAGTALPAFDTTSGLSTNLVNFMLGKDVNNERGLGQTSWVRPSVHGDVIHSRPLPINYGDSRGIVVYYGANDGTLRAVDASSGKEKWAFIAPEFYSDGGTKLSRLMNDTPLLYYPPNPVSGSTRKDYFFDGSIGFFHSGDNSKIWIFPSMRRGGRMVYGLDVGTPDTPKFKWKAGCPNLSDDTSCADGAGKNASALASIGQTWSTPRGARIKGYTNGPVVIFGGGYDSCEDDDTTGSPTCSSAKGGAVFILDADTGALIKSFTTSGRVASDITLVDINSDGYADYAYAATTAGNIYRIDFVDGPSSVGALTYDKWNIYPVAYTHSLQHKFLFEPAALYYQSNVFLALGSGDREHPLSSDYPYKNVTNRFYVYMDDLTVQPSSLSAATDLDQMQNYTSTTNCTTTPVLPGSGLKGWYMNLNQYGQGEQTVTSALIVNGMVAFSTNRPLPSDASCSNGLGEARGYLVNLLNASGAIGSGGVCGGTRSSVFAGGGLPPSPVLARSVPIKKSDGTTEYLTVTVGVVDPSGKGVSASGDTHTPPNAINSTRKRIYSYSKGQN